MFPRLSLDTPIVAVAPLAVFGAPDDAFELPPPPQPATASAARRSKAPAAGRVMNRLVLIEYGSFRMSPLVTRTSVVAVPLEGIGGNGRRPVPLTAVLESLLAGSGAGRWPRRPGRAQTTKLSEARQRPGKEAA